MSRDQIVRAHYDSYVAALVERKPDIITYFELDNAVPPDGPTVGSDAASADAMRRSIVDGQVQKALVILLKQKLDADPAVNQRFLATTKVPLWNQLLAAARIKELARARIVKKGGRKQLRYDVADLAKTYFGKALLTEAGLARQKILDKPELQQLQAACAKVKLTLPETIEPTTTEMFFDDAVAEQVNAAKAAAHAKTPKRKAKKKPSP